HGSIGVRDVVAEGGRGGLREVLVRLIEGPAAFAAQPEAGGDDAVGGAAELPGQVVEVVKLTLLRGGAALRVVFDDLAGEFAPEVGRAPDDPARVQVGQTGLVVGGWV